MNNNLTSDKPITSYEDLVSEKKRLTELLKVQRTVIQHDIDELKAELRPIVNVSSVLGKLLTRENNNDAVVTAGTNLTIDLLVAKLFSKSNFFLKLVLPAVLKNLSSHFIPKATVPRKKDHVTIRETADSKVDQLPVLMEE